ncbi:hypothetical protein N7532_002888 [Penicillium argentinense]|uniref:Uncharacterized protein n=1 Tax=Penicillium argentinense TaxID=1131581 RepID=A0A9W9G1A2_9EURO|nr:uncharacterized protein N7532_002888 [Penicillium argentinense]KAJ5110243.1 hypothetical protein N7532_002888 [Penicillium argentinense]
MSFFGRRRRSQSLADQDNSSTRQQVPRHPSLGSHGSGPSEGFFHGLFRRSSDSSLSADTPKHERKPTSAIPLCIETDRSPRRRNRDESSQSSGDSTPSIPGPPKPATAAAAHNEPKQPGNIQDHLEYRLDKACRPKDDADPSTSNGSIMTKDEIKALFSGAPHFLLERGKHKRWYPQVIFPWDEHNPSIQRMLDRKPLPHPAFTLCTLHAHLPVPDDWAVRGGVPTPIEDWGRRDASRRATFDVGIFEVPNMLANNGREPGTVGFRHFLELPLADAVRFSGPGEPRQAPNLLCVSSLPATEAFDLMENYNKPYSQCLSGAVYDRHQLLRDGPSVWKRIGVRDINLRVLMKRLDHLRQIRQGVLRDGSTMTILDYETPHEQYNMLHSHFLYPRPPPADVLPGHPQSIKSQIKTLVTVLATPGAWVDFSLPEWRFRAGQLLWEVPPHGDGDYIDEGVCNGGTRKEPWVNSGMERKWLLVQLLLAAELLIRLDAFVRIDMLHDPHGGQMTVQELYHFDKLREGKVNWDLVVVRRFLDNLEITCPPTSTSNGTPVDTQASEKAATAAKPRRFTLFESLGRRISSNAETELHSAWLCRINSPHTRQQLEGLYNFAENIGWPNIDALRMTFDQKLRDNKDIFSPQPGIRPSQQETTASQPAARSLAKENMYSRSASRRCVRLHSRCADDHDPHADEPLGWISRSWLSGFVIPGEPICHLLIGTLLENDAAAVQHLGPTANLYGGFAYAGRSWWSKACIVGRVLSSLNGAQTCMGWVGSDVLPRDATKLEVLGPGWFEVLTEAPLERSGKPRIKQGCKLEAESTPLGIGDITADAFTLPIDQSTATPVVSLGALTLSISTSNSRAITTSDETSLSFSLHGGGGADTQSSRVVTFPLKHNVRFISAHACCPPRGSTLHHPGEAETPSAAEHRKTTSSVRGCGKGTRLAGHPLHRSFPYERVGLETLSQHTGPPTPGRAGDPDPAVLVIDARGDRVRETFVRAWCAAVGRHALIGRAGRTCIACCVREARAVDVQVVVRVGE